MIVSITDQIYIFYTLIILGMLLCILFDFLRALKKVLFRKKVWSYVFDIIFWIIASIVTFIHIKSRNYGILRAYILYGEIFGFIIYKKVIKNTIFFLFVRFFNFILKLFVPIVNMFDFISKKINNFFKILYNFFKKVYYIRKEAK